MILVYGKIISAEVVNIIKNAVFEDAAELWTQIVANALNLPVAEVIPLAVAGVVYECSDGKEYAIAEGKSSQHWQWS